MLRLAYSTASGVGLGLKAIVERSDVPTQLRHWLRLAILFVCCVAGFRAAAAGSGLNTVVVINQASSNSLELGNYYCELRDIPPQNVLFINWTGTNTSWSNSDFQTNLLVPLQQMLAVRQLTNQVDYVVCSMDIPFQTINGSAVNSTTSALFYGLSTNAGSDVANTYAASEANFEQARPATASGSSFLATMITADSLAEAEQMVDQGVAGDGTFPQQPVVLAETSDNLRNIRFPEFDNAIFNVRLRGGSNIMRTNTDSLWSGTNFLGYETGLANYTIPDETFVPGAIADDLTSYGGIIFGPNSQTTLFALIDAGASGSYGTVSEPGADPQKFPNPQVYFYQARGFSLAESYYQSVNTPFLGLIVAEPLSAPFAQQGSGRWTSTNTSLIGIANLSVQFNAAPGRTLEQIDLFVDGNYWQTLTNATPQPGNVLTVTLNGYPVTYTVPTNASLGSAAAGLAAVLNSSGVSNATMVVAYPHGDRVELQSLVTNVLAEPLYFNDAAGNATNCYYQAVYLPTSSPPKITPRGFDKNGAYLLHVDIASSLPYVIQASSNLTDWVPVFTNQSGGLLDFADAAVTNYPRRFYRVQEFVPNPRPKLSLFAITNSRNLDLHIDADTKQPYAIQISTNFSAWTSVFTNQFGGVTDYMDSVATNGTSRFYRASLISPAQPSVTALQTSNGNPLLEIKGAMQPFVVDESTNPGEWFGLYTNYVLGVIQTAASSSLGTANSLTTFLNASSSSFMQTAAFGRQSYAILNSSLPAGAYLRFTITKTNGGVVTVGLTNQTAGTSGTTFAQNFYNLINGTPSLQGPDGVVAKEFGSSGSASFNLCPRTPGLAAAAGLQVAPTASQMFVLPSSRGTLTQNISDLRPRNHLYVTAGASRLGVSFALNTSNLADGYHELTAVAYEGSNVRTQTKAILPVVVANTSLIATLTLLDMTNTAPVQGSYHIQVTANTTNSVNNIALYSTGGILGTASNQSSVTFQFNGTQLGVGSHPFYAVVQDSSGASYRTQTQSVRFD